MSAVIQVENLSKTYRLGVIGGGTLRADVSRWLAKMSGKPDPTLKIGQESHARLSGLEFKALEDVSFDVKQGEILGVIGRNGAGKSTLLKVLSRVTAPTRGEVRVRGRIASLLEVGTGFHPELTGRENVYLNGAILGMTRAEIRKKFDEIVAFSGVEDFIDTPVKRYSSGMYVRLAFAVAAHLEPEILIVDEVLAVGDAEFQKKCMGKMQEVSGRDGRTILFVSHNMAAIQRLCQKCVILSKGRLSAAGDTGPIIGEYLRSSASTAVSLEDFPERSGTGAVRLTGFHAEDLNGRKVDQVQSGMDFDLVFQFKCAKPGRTGKVDIGFSLHQADETTLSVVYSSYTGKIFENIPAGGEFRCRISRFPVKEGLYRVGARVTADGQEADWPQGMIGDITVVAGDFYGSGAKGFDGSAPLLLSAGWSLK